MRRPRAKFVSVLCSPIPCRLLNARAARLPFIPLPSPVRPWFHPCHHFMGPTAAQICPKQKAFTRPGREGVRALRVVKFLGCLAVATLQNV